MRMAIRAAAVAAASTTTLLVTGGAAVADDVAASSADFQLLDGQRTIVLEVGESASVTLSYAVVGEGKNAVDGKAGCNLTGQGSNLTLDVVGTADPGVGAAGVSGLPEEAVFADCGDEVDPTTVLLAFTATAPGRTTYTFPVDATKTVGQGTWNSTAASFVVVVLDPDGRDAPAIANEWLREVATTAERAACQDANGTNADKSNWHGQLINKIAQFFEGESFTPEEEQVVVDKVREYCGL